VRRGHVISLLAVALLAGALACAAQAKAPAKVRLTVRYTDSNGHVSLAHLKCVSGRVTADGYLSDDPEPACVQARKLAKFLRSKPARRQCTQIFGSRQKAHMTGSIGGRRVDRRFSRTNGCGIADWRKAGLLLPKPA
jgi:hypothetical protein